MPAAKQTPAATCVVTGATSGLGRAITAGLLAQGAQVVLVARDEQRAARTLEEYRRAGLAAAARAQVVLVDLRSPAQTRAAALRLLEVVPRIDVLVHCAGVWPARMEHTAEGLETSFAVNALAPMILNRVLGARLADSAARVVQVTAGLYRLGRVDVARTPFGRDFHPVRTYADTKLCNILATLETARANAGAATFNLVHPGVVRTGLGDRAGVVGWLLRGIKLLWSSPATGARAPLYLATNPAVRGISGRYFDRLRERPLVGAATDQDLGRRLWARMLELAQVD